MVHSARPTGTPKDSQFIYCSIYSFWVITANRIPDKLGAVRCHLHSSVCVSIYILLSFMSLMAFSSLDLYYLAFPSDIIPLKCLVVAIYALEAAQTFMLTDTAFNTFAYGYGDLEALNTIGTTWVSIAVLGAICESYIDCYLLYRLAYACLVAAACIVQTFYAWRIMMMSGRRRFFVVITSVRTLDEDERYMRYELISSFSSRGYPWARQLRAES